MAIVDISTVMKFLQITDYNKADIISALIPMVEADFLRIRNKAFDIDSSDEIEYPDNAELIASQMIAYHLTSNMRAGGAMSGESIGSLSYTRVASADMLHGYPKSIVERIERYISIK